MHPKQRKRVGKFWEKVDKNGPGGCWLWMGCKKDNGYGHVTFRQKQMGAHRQSWIMTYGEIPEGMDVCHKCDVRPCVNPAHLFLATHEQNMRDAWAKGRLTVPTCRPSRLTAQQLDYIRNGPLGAAALARKFGISSSYAKRIRAGGVSPKPTQ